MASSGSIDFTVTRDNIISLALQDMGVMASTDTTSSSSFTNNSTTMALKLNQLVKQWQGKADFAPGLKEWHRRFGTLFLQKSQNTYTLGPSGDKFADSYNETTLSAAASSGASTITVSATTGFAASAIVGIVLDTGAIQWTTESGAPSGSTITLAATLTGNAASGNRVFTYTTANAGRMPIGIVSAVMRDVNGKDVQMRDMRSIERWMAIADKTTLSTPYEYVFQRGDIVTSNLYIPCYPSDVTKRIYMCYLSPAEDFDAASDNPDYPAEWFRALQYGLTCDTLGLFGQEARYPYFKTLRDEALSEARGVAVETSDAYFMSCS